MINLLEKLEKISENQYCGFIKLIDIKELLENNTFVINKQKTKLDMQNDNAIEIISVNPNSVKEIEKSIMNNNFQDELKLSYKNNEFIVEEGFYILIAIHKIENLPDGVLKVRVIKE